LKKSYGQYILIYRLIPQDLFPVNYGYSFTTNTNLSLTVADPENDKLRVRFYGRKKNTTTTTTGKFTIILLPDTQYYTAEPQGTNGGENSMFKSQTAWIAKNRALKNIVYVSQLGDCVEHKDSRA